MSISAIFNTILYQPLLNILVALYAYLPGHDFGVAVILLTLLVKLILFPISLKTIRSQRAMNDLQPKIKAIQEKFKNDKAKQSQAMMELYKKEKINPLSGCLPMLLQLPILLALYQVFLKGLKPEALKSFLYGGVPYPEVINFSFLGIIDLSKPNFILAILAGGLQFFQSKISMPKKDKTAPQKGDFSSLLQSQTLYFLPIFTVFIVWKLGSLIGLYWVVSTLFSIAEHYIIKPKIKSQDFKVIN
jgi:YidC/Oxa1 family membrane protein insertase